MFRDICLKKLFLIISLFFGVLYAFILPPFQSVDEARHFYRTYQISTGNLVAKNVDGVVGDYLPESLSEFYNLYAPMIKNIDAKTNLSDFKRNFNFKLDKDKTVYTEFANTALYSPVGYVSQVVGVSLAKAINFPLAGIYYMGRLSNLIFYCLFVYLALCIIPFFKLPMFLLALMPMSLSLAGAYTCDVTVLGLSFVWVAMILRFLVDDRTQKLKNIELGKILVPLFILMAFLIAFTKSYILLLPLIFLVPVSKFKNKIRYVLFLIGVLSSALLGGLIWYFTTKGLSLNMNVADSDLQLAFIKSHPLAYIKVLLTTCIVKAPRLFVTMIGVLGWQDTRLDWITYIAYPILIYFAVIADSFKFVLRKWQKLVIVLTLIFGIILTFTSLYLMWSPVGNNVVLGLNGKYFIPLVLPFLLLFKNENAKFDYKIVKLAVVVAVVIILLSSDLSLLHRFYDLTPQLYYKI